MKLIIIRQMVKASATFMNRTMEREPLHHPVLHAILEFKDDRCKNDSLQEQERVLRHLGNQQIEAFKKMFVEFTHAEFHMYVDTQIPVISV